MVSQELDLMISSAISGDESKEKYEKNKNKIRVTRGVNEKIQLYADLTSRITKTPMECYGYLLRPKWSNDTLITEVLFAYDQIVTPAHVIVPVEGIKKAMEDADQKGYEIIGWWHSHDDMTVFHSPTDDANFKSVLNGISPHTMFRIEEAPYIVDEKNRRVIFDDYALTELIPEEMEIFKKRKIKALKKVSYKPFALSIVVNNNKDRYLERITKTMICQNTGEFKIDDPTYPQLDLVDVDKDLEFMVADVEWEIREKLIVNQVYLSDNHNLCNNENELKNTDGTIQIFLKNMKEYIKKDGDYSSDALKILSGNPKELFNYLKSARKSGISEGEMRKFKNLSSDRYNSFKENIKSFLEETSDEKYKMWRKKIHLFDRYHIVSKNFIEDFCNAGKSKSPSKRLSEQSKVFNKSHNIALKLNESFEIADKAMKSMTKYSMETTTDYYKKLNHNYKNLIGSIITRLCGKNGMNFEDAMGNVLSLPSNCRRNKFFIWGDRFDICDQITLDMYRIKNNSLHNNDVTKKRKYSEFFEDFAYSYNNKPEMIDQVIEKYILNGNNISKRKYFKFNDSNYNSPEKRCYENIFRLYRPKKSLNIYEKSFDEIYHEKDKHKKAEKKSHTIIYHVPKIIKRFFKF